MKIELVPSTVSPGEARRGSFLSTYLIDDVIAIDAGGLGLLGDLSAQFRIRDVFLTHGHIDHIASLPIFLETVFQSSDRCVTLHASAATLDSLRKDIFNGRVWPDFIEMSQKGLPFVEVKVLEPGHHIDVAGVRFTPIAVDHVVPTLGFLVESDGTTVAIPSDTGPTESFWRAAGAAADLKGVFLEASFPNAMSGSRHFIQASHARNVRGRGPKAPQASSHDRGAHQAAHLRAGRH